MGSNRLVLRLMLRGLQAIIRLLWNAIPPLCKALIAVATVLYKTSISVSTGLKPQIDQIARQIKDDLCNYVPTNFHRVLNNFAVSIAYLAVILGFVLISHLTVWVWQWLWSFI